MATISAVRALEILDSRGSPTVRVSVQLSDGSVGTASVPSGKSTGEHEALELRDGDKQRYGGSGVRQAVANVNGPMTRALRRRNAGQQEKIDQTLCALDGTEEKSSLGANAILGVSLAVAVAAARAAVLPLYAYLRRLAGIDPKAPYRLPLPLMNVVNGGKHADSGLDVQEFMILPVGAPTFAEALRAGVETFHALAAILRREAKSTSVGDEGGYAPKLERNDEVFGLLTEASAATGRRPGTDVVFGVDVAASEFYTKKTRTYDLQAPRVSLSRERLLALYVEWLRKWPLKTIEDPLDENDWAGWAIATAKLRDAGAQVVGDDFFATNVKRLKRGVEQRCASAILVKVNQIGTLSETLAAIRLAQEHQYGVIISHRSGETADTFIADLAVGTDAGQIKTGSLSRSERVEKYNRLLEIEAELGKKAQYAGGAALRA